MSRSKHCPFCQWGDHVRRLYYRDDTGGKTRWTKTPLYYCPKCGAILKDTDRGYIQSEDLIGKAKIKK